MASSVTIGFGGSVGAESPMVLTGSAMVQIWDASLRWIKRH